MFCKIRPGSGIPHLSQYILVLVLTHISSKKCPVVLAEGHTTYLGKEKKGGILLTIYR